MTSQEILTKAIQKAIDSGWIKPEPPLPTSTESQAARIARTAIEKYDGHDHVNDIIFNHDFAKALWGDKFINPEMRDDTGSKVIAMKQTAWRHHLRQMVVADDPIKYLGENI